MDAQLKRQMTHIARLERERLNPELRRITKAGSILIYWDVWLKNIHVLLLYNSIKSRMKMYKLVK